MDKVAVGLGALLCLGCSRGNMGGDGFASEGDPASTGAQGDGSTGRPGTGSTSDDGGSTGGADSTTVAVVDDDSGLFDLSVPDTPPPATGCAKVDFLFVIDNSASMEVEQEQLLASFGGFIDTIENTVAAQDYQILVTTTSPPEDACECGGVACFDEADLIPQCVDLCINFCGGVGEDAKEPGTCDEATGVGNDTASATGQACDFVSGGNYIDANEPDLHAAFDCAGDVPPEGNGQEFQVGSILGALQESAGQAGCNPGFLRDDAVLVVTIITDEDETGFDLEGGPQQWHDAIIDAKGGLEEAVVMLGLVGDTGLRDAMCDVPLNEGGAENADTLREFIDTFGERGLWGSVCAPDYSPFFGEAVTLIDDACDSFPAG
ncbi:MAG: hypothetical protein AAF721_17570 [Myxococcota bacterium]